MQIIELYIKGYNRINGSAKSFATNKLIDSIADFTQNVVVGNIVTNLRTQETVKITAIDSATQLSLSDDIFTSPNYDEYRIESDYFRADLFGDESVTITDSLLNVRDIGKIFTPFSQQFNLPASKLNNQLFRHYENQDVENSFDARYRHDAIIKLNGIDYKKGKIQFKSVTLKDNKAHAYKVVFFGDTVELKEVLGETKLSGLLYPDSLNFEYTQNNITNLFALSDNSLESIYGSTDIVVPNIHHSKNMRYTNSGYLDNTSGTGLSWVDLKPAIRLKAIIDAIENTFPQITFNEYSFWNVSGFRQFYMWMHRNEGYVTNATEGGGTQVVSNRWKLGVDDYTFTGNDPSYASVGDVRGVALDSPIRYYRFQVNIQSSTTETYTVKILKASTGETLYEHTHTQDSFTWVNLKTDNYGYGELDIIVEVTSNNTITMTQDVEVTKFTKESPLSPLFTIQWIAEYDAVVSNTGNTFYVNKNMPDMKVMDFLSGLFKMFNLVVFKEGDKIDVQLAKFYMNQGTSYDITKYVDMSSSSVERLFQYKEMDFKFKSKKTFLVQKSDEIQGIPFSEEDYPPTRSEFDGGVYKVELPFEKMMYERLSNEDTDALTLIGQGAFLNQQFEPTIGEPLILCVAYQQDVNDEITIDGGGVGYYRRPTQLSNFTWGYTTRLQLNFGLEADEFLREVPSNATNLFQDGYLDYVETVFDRKSRLLKVSAYLPLSIILKYKLKDKFVINNKSYRINSIKTNLLTNKTDLELYNKDEFVSQVDNAQFAYLDRVAQVTVTTKSTDFITIGWTAVTGVVGYDVILNGGVFTTTVGTSLKVNGLESGTTYNIGVRAKYNISGDDAYSFDTTITETTL